MDHSENDKRFCVYVHKDLSGDIVYVGSGNSNRPFTLVNRSQDHRDVWHSLTKEVVEDGLSKTDSLIKEQELLDLLGTTKLNRSSNITIPKTVEYDVVSKYVYYDDTSSTFLRWKLDHRRGNSYRVKDTEAGYLIAQKGYLYVGIDSRRYSAHRVIWVLCNNRNLPANLVVDHIDRSPKNNNISNLRAVTPQQNQRNTSLRKDSATGAQGVLLKASGYVAEWEEGDSRKSIMFAIQRFIINCSHEEASARAFDLACKYRALKVETVYNGNMTKENIACIKEIDDILNEKYTTSRNTSGFSGVSWNQQLSKWYAIWVENKKQKTKCFNPIKLFPSTLFEEAKQKAFELAIEFRKNKELELNAA